MEFIEQKRRRSKSNDTVKAYLTALVHLNNLTSTQYNCTIETILSLLKEGKVDVYKLLGSFVDYLSPKISAKTFEPYMGGVKSYLEYHDIDIKCHGKIRMESIKLQSRNNAISQFTESS
jgi:hypothetical protein